MRHIALFLIVAVLLTLSAAADQPQKVYVCPMAEHAQEFDKPGSCPICGMALIPKEGRFRVAVLVFNYAEDIDFTAPIEVLGHTGAEIFTVAATTDPINTVFGLHLRPDYDLAHAPAADLILVPGGGVSNALKNDQVIGWLKERAPNTRYVMSVCNGAFILGKAGLLDGLTATTTSGRIEELAETYPKVNVVRRRLVDNGRVITTAGLSAGIDGALHVIERVYNRERAEDVARGIEYRWDPNSNWTRSSLADSRFPDVRLPDDARWEKLSSRGDTDQWEMTGRLNVAMSQEEVLDSATKQLVAKGWVVHDTSNGKRSFVKKDRDGQTWSFTIVSTPDTEPSTYKETLSIRKVRS